MDHDGSKSIPLGVRIYGLGAAALGLVGIVWGDFALQWQPVAASFPGRTLLAYLFSALLVLAGATVNGRRASAAFGAQALIVLYGIVVVFMHGAQIVQHPGTFPVWSGAAEQLALVAGGLAAYARVATIPYPRRAQLVHIAVIAMAVCLLTFGAAHFVYLDFTASMVPAWLPGGQRFWAAFTGLAHMAAGIALLSGIQARRAAILLTVMFASFSALVHLPLLLAQHSHLNWVMNAVNLALTGAAWSLAGSFTSALPQTNTRPGKPTEAGAVRAP